METTIVALYLLSCPHANMIGLYYIPKMLISHETGLTVQGASKGLQRAFEGGFCAYDDASETVWVYEMARFQIGDQLSQKDKRVKGVNNSYQSLHNNPFLYDFYLKYKDKFHLEKPRGLEAPSKPLRSQEQEQEQDIVKSTNVLLSSNSTRRQLAGDQSTPVRNSIPYKKIIDHFNQTAGTSYKDTSKATRLKIKARFNEGFTYDDFVSVIDHKVSEWQGDDRMNEYIRPSTIFSTKFEGYLQAAKKSNGGARRKNRWQD